MSYNHPEVVVGIFILNSNHEVLLIKSPKWKSGQIWLVPGGHIDFGETIENAVVREAEEEIGAKVKYKRVITVLDGVFPKDFHEKKHFVYLECEAVILPNEKIQIDNDEIIEAKWWNITEALKLNDKVLHYQVKKVLKFL